MEGNHSVGKTEKPIARKAVGLVLTALLFSLYFTFPYLDKVFNIWKVLAIFVRYFVYSMIVCLAAYKGLRSILPNIHWRKAEAVIYGRWSDRKYFLVLFVILTVSRIPTYLSYFPGIFGYDSPVQMMQITTGVYTSHHPLLHTLLLKLFLTCGNAVFGTYNGGVALFCVFQGLVVCGSIAYSLLAMKEFKVPLPILLVSLAWCIWSPVLQVLTFNTTKDILFGVLFLHFITRCYHWLNGGKKTLVRCWG